MELGGGEKRGRAWAAGGRGLQLPRAATAAAPPALSAPRSDWGAHCAGTRAPPGGAAAPRPRLTSATRRSYVERGSSSECWGFGGRSLLSLAGGLAGKEGESGDTHLPRRARIAHSQPRAPAEARPGEFGPAAPAPAPASFQRYSRPRPWPADPRDPGLHCSPFARGSNNISVTCRLWRNWSRKRRRPNAARVR